MNSFYSSDEEIAWGPITLKEIKGDLKRPRPRKPERRHTMFSCPKTENKGLPKVTIEPPSFCREMEEKCNISSTCDEYYSPNTSEISSHRDKENSVQESSEYLTASDTKMTVDPYNHTQVDFVNAAMNRNSYFDIQNFHQTLVEPSMVIPEESIGNFCPNNSTESQEEVIVISSDEEGYFESGAEIKREKYSNLHNVSAVSQNFSEKNRSIREIEECSIYKTDDASNRDSMDKSTHNCTLDSYTSNEKGNSSYQSTSSGNVGENESSDDVTQNEEAASNLEKYRLKLLKKSLTSESDDDVLCIDEDADVSYSEEPEDEIEKENSIYKVNDTFDELHNDPNLLNGRKSRKSFIEKSTDTSLSDEIEWIEKNKKAAMESFGASCNEDEGQKYDCNDSRLESNKEKEDINHVAAVAAVSLDETDLLTSEHRPEPNCFSPVSVPKIDLSQFDDTYDALSQLDDTMERMDRLLRMDANENGSSGANDIISASFLRKPTSSLSDDVEEAGVTPLKERKENVGSAKKTTTPNGRFESTTTPVKAKQPTKPTSGCKSHIPKPRKSPAAAAAADTFKMPVTPVWQKPPPTTKASPKTGAHFKNIVSPVGMYIRYSPRPVLKQNVGSATKTGRIDVDHSPAARRKNKENLDALPAVIYKPGKRQIATAEEKVTLPPSLDKMIVESVLTKHNRKALQYKSSSKIQEKLADDIELTSNSISESLLEDPNQDVSILHKRDRPFLK